MPVDVPAARAPARLGMRWTFGAGHLLGLAVVFAFLLVFFVIPLVQLVAKSLQAPGGQGLGVGAYLEIAQSDVYRRVVWNTVRLAVETTLITLLIGYPLGYVLSRLSARVAAGLLVLVVVPYFTSTLVRTYAWMVLLGRTGLVNQVLQHLGLTRQPVRFLYNETGVLIGFVYVFLPFMVLVLYSVMRGIDPRYLQAAASAGAGPMRTFWRVYLPLSMPGVVAGSLLTFVMTIGSYITPALMGSPRQTMVAMTIQQQIEQLLNWNFPAALGVVLLLLVLLACVLYQRLVGMAQLFESSL
jgi:putative spermidine/putrescine transport system permease protein